MEHASKVFLQLAWWWLRTWNRYTFYTAFMREGVHRELLRSLLQVHRMLYGWTCASKEPLLPCNWIRGSFNQEMHSCSVGEQVVGKCVATGNYGSSNCCHGDWELATFYTAFFAGGIGGELVDSLLMVHRMIAEWTYSSKVFSMAVVKRGLMVRHMEELPLLQKASSYVEVSYGCIHNVVCWWIPSTTVAVYSSDILKML